MAKPLPRDEDPILEINQASAVALKSGDVECLVSFLADDVIFMPPADCTLYGKAEVEEWYEEYFEFFEVTQLDETERSVSVVGDLLVERAAVSITLQPRKGGTPIYDEA